MIDYAYACSAGSGKVSDDIIIIEVCKYMGGWDLETYFSQPEWFIELIKGKINVEARLNAARSKQASRT